MTNSRRKNLDDLRPPSLALLALEFRAPWEFGALLPAWPALQRAPRLGAVRDEEAAVAQEVEEGGFDRGDGVLGVEGDGDGAIRSAPAEGDVGGPVFRHRDIAELLAGPVEDGDALAGEIEGHDRQVRRLPDVDGQVASDLASQGGVVTAIDGDSAVLAGLTTLSPQKNSGFHVVA